MEKVRKMDGFVDASVMMRGGVYLLKHRGEIVYIGKAKNFLARTYSHRSIWSRQRSKDKVPAWLAQTCKGIIFDQIFLRPCAPEVADALERELIALYKPRHNIQHVKDIAPLGAVLAAQGLLKAKSIQPSQGLRRL